MTAAKKKEDLIKRPWTAEEDARLRKLWPSASYEEIGLAFPDRTRHAIGGRASALKIQCDARNHPNKVVSPVIMREGVAGKACVQCLVWQPLNNFSNHATCARGLRNVCSACETKNARQVYSKNSVHLIKQVRKYQARYPERVLAQRRNSRSRKTSGDVVGIDEREYKAIFALYGGMCAYCGEPAQTIDHVEALSRGGDHRIENIVPACNRCNAGKREHTPEEWFASPTAKRGRRIARERSK